MTRPAISLLHAADGRPAHTGLTEDDLVELYRYPDDGRRCVRSNFIASLDGSVQGPDGRAGGIGTSSDRYVFALHRALADAVVVGAGTARAEGYRSVDLQPWQLRLRERLGLAPYPALVILSRSGRVDPVVARPQDGDGGPVMIITVSGHDHLGPLRAAGIEVVETGPDLDLRRALDGLTEQGWPRLLCEGGPGLHRDLLAAGLVDELSLTLAPVVVGGQGLRSTSGGALRPPVACTLDFVLHAGDGTLFTSYRRHTSASDHDAVLVAEDRVAG